MFPFQSFEDRGEGHIALDLTDKLLFGYSSLVVYGDIVPAGELTHRRLQIRVVEVEITVLPGRDLIDIYMGQGFEFAGSVKNGLFGGF